MKGERYRIKDFVFHKVFGAGVIIDKFINRIGELVLVVKFDSLSTNRNIVANFYGIRRMK